MDSFPGPTGSADQPHLNAVTHAFTDGPGGHMLIKALRLGKEQSRSLSRMTAARSGEVQRHVFDPFFTTRRAQGSIGLGPVHRP